MRRVGSRLCQWVCHLLSQLASSWAPNMRPVWWQSSLKITTAWCGPWKTTARPWRSQWACSWYSSSTWWDKSIPGSHSTHTCHLRASSSLKMGSYFFFFSGWSKSDRDNQCSSETGNSGGWLWLCCFYSPWNLTWAQRKSMREIGKSTKMWKADILGQWDYGSYLVFVFWLCAFSVCINFLGLLGQSHN